MASLSGCDRSFVHWFFLQQVHFVPEGVFRRSSGDYPSMSDRTLTCRDCGQAFVFTAGEQAFYTERGYSEPLRCPSCRAARKQQRSSGGDSYGGGGYSSGGGYGGGDSYSSGRSGGGGYGGGDSYSRGPRQMYPAVCSQCGKETEVPFQPTAGKPVYCRECFQDRRSSSYSY
jgi:CxxC-x17-CxxC domain-containing protein